MTEIQLKCRKRRVRDEIGGRERNSSFEKTAD